MKTPRRQFVQSASAAVSVALCGVLAIPQVPKHGMPTPPPAVPEPGQPENANSAVSKRANLQQHEKEFRNSLSPLSERVSELQQGVEQLHSADIFSIKIYKQTTEIERLAKQLKSLAKS